MTGSDEKKTSSDVQPQGEPKPNAVQSSYKTRGKISDPDGTGVFGYNDAATGFGNGVFGQVDSNKNSARGVYGEATNSSGSGDGVVGRAYGPGYAGQLTEWATGVTGQALNQNGVKTFGVYGSNNGDGAGTAGVIGWSLSDDGQVYGVRGETNSDTSGAAGVWGDAHDSTGQIYGVKGSVSSGIGAAVHADGRLTASDTIAGDPTNKTDHVAFVENDVSGASGNAQIMMLSMPLQGTSPSSDNNFITFRAGKDEIGAIEGNNGGVTLNTSSADLGEYFPLADPTLEPAEGTVLGLSAGELSRETADAEAALVVTQSPAVLGNNPKAGENEEPADQAAVALIGQVPVTVTASVEAGDRLVAAGDGTARVGGPDDDALTVGRALESVTVADGEGETVRTFVGGPLSETPTSADEVDPEGVVEAEYEETIAELRRENERLSDENEDLRSRLEDLEGTVEGLVADADEAGGPQPADD